MSLGARPVAPVHDVRDAARRQARSLSGGAMAVLGAVAAAVLVIGFVVLDYQFGQASHRLFKILAGCVGAGIILLWPRFGILLLAMAIPFLDMLPKIPVPGVNSLNGLLLGIFFAYSVGRVLSRQSVFRPMRLGLALGAFVLIAALSIVRGVAFPTGYVYEAGPTSLQLFRAAVLFLGYFIALSMTRGESDRRRLAIALVIGIAGQIALTIVWGRNGSGGRAVGSLGQANELGAFLAIGTAFAAALIPGVRSFLGRVLLGAVVVAGCYATLLSVSRGAMVALALAMAYVAVRSSRWMTVVIVVALLTSPVWAPDYVKERVLGTQEEVEGTDEVELEASAQARVETWQTTLKIVSEHPIDGVGFGGLGYILQDIGSELGFEEVKDSAHNTFLRVLGEMGILGLFALVALFFLCFKLSLDAARVAGNRFDRQLAIGLGACVVALVASCTFGDRLFRFEIVGGFWMLCGIVNDLWLERRDAAAATARGAAA